MKEICVCYLRDVMSPDLNTFFYILKESSGFKLSFVDNVCGIMLITTMCFCMVMESSHVKLVFFKNV